MQSSTFRVRGFDEIEIESEEPAGSTRFRFRSNFHQFFQKRPRASPSSGNPIEKPLEKPSYREYRASYPLSQGNATVPIVIAVRDVVDEIRESRYRPRTATGSNASATGTVPPAGASGSSGGSRPRIIGVVVIRRYFQRGVTSDRGSRCARY